MNKKKIAILGGGTGLSAILRGIKYVNNIEISAIVTVADSGGSTGVLSKEFNIPAVGDLRRVIAALSLDRADLQESMEYRFSNTKSKLDGHTIGNLIITSQILMKQDFASGIEAATKMLNVKGNIIPVSNQFNHLFAELSDGTIVQGEDKIGHSKQKIERVYYEKQEVNPRAVKAILEADYIILGIGSLYTSLIANLIYKDIKEALKKTKGEILYFANIFTQNGETDNMTLKDHIEAIEKHTHKNIVDQIVVSNTPLTKTMVDSYKNENQDEVFIDMPNVLKYDLIKWDSETELVRHDEEKIHNFFQEYILKNESKK